MKFYAGIGSRETPRDILVMMSTLAWEFERLGWKLSSGAAAGADLAFENGVVDCKNKRIYIPSDPFNGRSSAEAGVYYVQDEKILKHCREVINKIHPAPERLSEYAMKLHARNVLQILGHDLTSPVSFVLYYAPTDKKGVPSGGTRTAVEFAKSLGIPTMNLLDERVIQRLKRKYNV